MSNVYTYRILVANRERVQVNKVNPQKQNLGQPSGVFGYRDGLKAEIDGYVTKAHAEELRQDEEVKALGEALFNALFDPVLRQDFVGLYNQAVHTEGKLLRIELDIDERALPDVAALPWEFMRLPQDANLGTLWVGSAPDLIFSRRRSQWFVPNPIRLEAGEKLRIAVAVSAPENLGPVQYDKVVQGLEKLVANQPDQFELLPVLTNCNALTLDELLAKDPHILHFIGHGRLQADGNHLADGQIAFTDDIFGEAEWVNADFFADLLNTHRPGVVLLQACEGGMASASQAFVGVASRIVQQNIPVVVAMQYEVSNITAVRFALKFYQELAAGSPVDRAAQNGRRAVALATQYKRRDFATPVLFMRVEDGQLFEHAGAAGQQPAAVAQNPAQQPPPANNANNANNANSSNIPTAAQAPALYKIIANNFAKEDFIDLCEPLGEDPENLRDSSKNSMAQDLFGKAQRTSRLDVLVKTIAAMRPETVDQLKGNLFVFLENLQESEVTQLCRELNLDCRALQLDENGLLGYTANKYIRVERMQALQDHMVQNGRYGDLVQAAKKYLPRIDFSTFER
ncbi:MAG: CHAT domain-containing protein [Candidatus Promineifilaceae bacterium]